MNADLCNDSYGPFADCDQPATMTLHVKLPWREATERFCEQHGEYTLRRFPDLYTRQEDTAP